MAKKTIKISCTGTTEFSLSELNALQGDLKTLTDENRKKLRRSILKHGILAPIFIWEDNETAKLNIMDGHSRRVVLNELKEEGYSLPQIPVDFISAENIEDAKIKLLAIASQYGKITEEGLKGYLDFSFDHDELFQSIDLTMPVLTSPILEADKEYTEVTSHLREKPTYKQVDGEDEVPEVLESKVVLGDLYILGTHRLMCGSSTDIDSVEKLVAGKDIDLVLADPPYGVSVVKDSKVGADFGIAKKGSYKEVINDDTTNTARDFYFLCKDLSFKHFILWGGNYFTDFLPPKNSWVIWNKRGDSGIQNTFADGELAWSSLGHPVRIHSQLWNGFIREGEKDKRVHPTQKPTALSEFCISLKKDCENVYDGFGGSGSSLIACEKQNKNCFMMELDPHYVAVIIERWEKFTGKEAARLNSDGSTTPWSKVKSIKVKKK